MTWDQRPYEWQAKAMDPLIFEGNRVGISTNNESGKTSFVATKSIIWYMDTFPGCTVITTSASARQIEQQLYPNLKACVKALPNGDKWKIRANNQFWVKAPNGSCCFSFATNDAGRAEGYHVPALHAPIHKGKEMSEDLEMVVDALREEYGFELVDKTRLLIVVDEAKSVDREIFQALERCRATNWLVISTPPTDPVGAFYDIFTRDKEKYRCVKTGKLNLQGGFDEFGLITYKDCPHLTANKVVMKTIELDLKTLGAGDAFVLSMHYGKFAAVGANMVFNMEKVEWAMRGLTPSLGRDREVALDFSGGGDEQTFFLRVGNTAHIIATWTEGDATVLADKICRTLQKLRWKKTEPVKGDNGGIGEAVNDILERKGWIIDRFEFGGKSRQKQYTNKRAEGFFKLAKHFALAEIRIPDDDRLKQQLSWHKYKTDDNRKRKIIPKDEMPSSPDRADTLMMVFYDYQPPELSDNPDDDDRFDICGKPPVVERGGNYEPWNSGGLLHGMAA